MKHPPIKIAEQGWEPAVDGKTEDGQGVFDVQGLPFAKESYQGSVTGVQLRERLGGGGGEGGVQETTNEGKRKTFPAASWLPSLV